MPSRVFRVGRSNTGLGLFATKKIPRRAAIVTYRGRLIPNDEADRRERLYNSRYMFYLTRHWTVDGSSRRNLGRYVNHSCEPNAEPVMRQRKIVFVASRVIRPGEEITIDYGEEYVEHFFKARGGCKCPPCLAKAARRKARLRKRRGR
jgi:SET domain-containing protein